MDLPVPAISATGVVAPARPAPRSKPAAAAGSAAGSASENKLLAALSADVYDALDSQFEAIRVRRGETLYNGVGPLRYVCFPTTARISLFVDRANGASAEVALVGNDGAMGIMTLICGVNVPFRAAVDTSGWMFRIKQEVLSSAVAQSAALREVLTRYLAARMIHIASNAVCNGHHSVEQRLCRALLMRRDRAPDGAAICVTQEMLASILGVRRPGVSTAAAHLRNRGIISYTRGQVHILDSEMLHRTACECYSAMREQVDKLQPG